MLLPPQLLLASLVFLASSCGGVSFHHSEHYTVELPPYLNRYILNLGSHSDPPLPWDNHTAVIAVEALPRVAALIPRVGGSTGRRRGASPARGSPSQCTGCSMHGHHWQVEGSVLPALP